MRNIACLECFQAGSLIHAVMIAAVIAFTARFTRRARESTAGDRRLFAFLFAVCVAEFVYYLRPNQIGWNHSLPLHLCDITGIMAAVAFRSRDRTARALLHFWGLALSSQALIFPALEAGPLHCDFWLYWIDHGAIIFAAVYDFRIRDYRPAWTDWRRATLLLALYAIVIAPFDKLTGLDYGFLGQTQLAERSMVSTLGPWPLRLPIMWICAIGGMALLQAANRWRRVSTVQDIFEQIGANSAKVKLEHRGGMEFRSAASTALPLSDSPQAPSRLRLAS